MSPQPQWSFHYCECIMIWELFKLWHDFHNEQLYCTSQADASTVFSFSFSPSAPMRTLSAQWQQANHSICLCPHFSIYEMGIIALASFKKHWENDYVKGGIILLSSISCSLLYFPGSRASMDPGFEQGGQTPPSRGEQQQHRELPMAQHVVQAKLQDTAEPL